MSIEEPKESIGIVIVPNVYIDVNRKSKKFFPIISFLLKRNVTRGGTVKVKPENMNKNGLTMKTMLKANINISDNTVTNIPET